MNNRKNLFNKSNKLNPKLKYFIISFGVFILALAVFSVLLFMHSIDYDLNNLVENTTTTTTEPFTEEAESVYSVEGLFGKSNLLFVVQDDEEKVDFIFFVKTDFGKKELSVKSIDGMHRFNTDGVYKSVNQTFADGGIPALNVVLNNMYGFTADEFCVFDEDGFKTVIKMFDSITFNLSEDIDYSSPEYNLVLSKGKQTISGDKAYKYLNAVYGDSLDKALCDLISSVLAPEYIVDAKDYFTTFVNSCETEISVVDFYDSLDTLTNYAMADDKFAVTVFKAGEQF